MTENEEEKKPTHPVKVVVMSKDADGNDVCLLRQIINSTESTYYFGAASMRERAIKELSDTFRVEITVVFPGKDELG